MKCPSCGKLILSSNQLICPKCYAVLKEVSTGGSFQYGVDLMAKNKFQEAAHVWRANVRKFGPPNDEEYQQILTASRDCIVAHLGDAEYYSREDFTDLAMELHDRDLMEDLMAGLEASIPEAKTKMQAQRLSAEYMYFVFNTFYVYPDLRDMVVVFKHTHDVMERIRQALDELPGTCKNAELELEFYIDYSSLIVEKINMRVARNRSNMATIVNYWDNQRSLTYAIPIIDSAREYSRVITAKRPSEKRISARLVDMDDSLDIYFGQPLGIAPKKKDKKARR